MSSLKSGFRFSPFSHLYIEEKALEYPITREITSKFLNSNKVLIGDYREVFTRPRQSFNLQKKAVKLILAVKKGEFLFKAPEVCHDFGFSNFYYTSPILNCPYNCSYCFLKGMYPSSNLVIFVNIEDYLEEIEKLWTEKKNLYIACSYETDLLAMERIVPYSRRFIDFCRGKKGLNIEVRTKSANIDAIKDVLPAENAVLSWTISTPFIAKTYEKNAPGIEKRVMAMKKAQELGFRVRLCFDPLIYYKGFEEEFYKLIEYIFDNIDKSKVMDAGIGVFRIPKEYMKNIRSCGIYDEIFYFYYEEGKKVFSVEKSIKEKMVNIAVRELSKFLPQEKIFYL